MVTKDLITISSQKDSDVTIGYGFTNKAELAKLSKKIDSGIASVSKLEEECQKTIECLNKEIDRLTNHADKVDCIFSVCSGLFCGIIDSIFVGEFSLDNATKWGSNKINKFVTKIARGQGCKSSNLENCVAFLENRYPFAGDSVTAAFGGGYHHHLRDFSHHPNILGLSFSIITQFTGRVYGTDVNGRFMNVAVEDTSLIGVDFSRKITLGVINWFFHMASDMAGSSSSIAGGKYGTGLPGPLVSLLKMVSALPLFQKKDDSNEMSYFVSKLFNGTLLSSRDANGKILPESIIKFDLRTELGSIVEFGKQSIPVIINECLVRCFYFFRRIYFEIKRVKPTSFKEVLVKINWETCVPFKNRTIVRMMTIASGTFCATDIIDAALRTLISGKYTDPATFFARMALRINIVGVGRFVIALCTDIGMGIEKRKKENERLLETSKYLVLRDANVQLHSAKMWIAVKDYKQTQALLLQQQHALELELQESLLETADVMKSIIPLGDKIRNNNPGLLEEFDDILF